MCGVVGHKATQCPNKVSEVADEQAKAANEPEQENSADLVSWGGMAYSKDEIQRDSPK